MLSLLGAPYTKLADGPGAKFDQPSGVPSLETVFRHLEAAGRIRITKKLVGHGRTVEVLV